MIAVLVIFIELSGCTGSNSQSDEEKKFIGTWKTNTNELKTYLGKTVTFFSDGTVSLEGMAGAVYKIKDGKLVIATEDEELQFPFDYTFSNNGNTLTLIHIDDGTPIIYTKQ